MGNRRPNNALLLPGAGFRKRLALDDFIDCAQFYAEHDDHHLLRIRGLRSMLAEGAR